MRPPRILSLLLSGAVVALSACDPPESPPSGDAPIAESRTTPVQEPARDSGIRVGAKLYDQQGEFWGTIVEVEDAHTFPNGVTEPAVKVDYGPRMGDSPVSPQWLPRRSAERFRVE